MARACTVSATVALGLLLLGLLGLRAGPDPARARRSGGYGPGGQDCGYVEVRPGAHLFYWLYYAGGGAGPAGRPLVVWLEGGPGAAASSYGNFGKLGPLDPAGAPRNTTWVNDVNLLFVDSPVATGYSYVDSAAALARTNRQTALDLVELTRRLLERLPALRDSPLYIFGESYGGKGAAEYALLLHRETAGGRLAANLKGVVMADSWLSGVDHVESWAPYLFHLGLLDSRGRSELAAAAARARAAAAAGEWRYATALWSSAWALLSNLTEGVDIYNFLNPVRADAKKGGKPDVPRGSAELMNGAVREALGVPATVLHSNDNSQVFMAQYDEFMQPATEAVEGLLSETDLNVLVYAGQCDVFTNMAGTMAWLERLSWPLAEAFRAAPRSPLLVEGEVAGALRRAGRLTALWVHRAGHMVANDYPAAAGAILRLVTSPDPGA